MLNTLYNLKDSIKAKYPMSLPKELLQDQQIAFLLLLNANPSSIQYKETFIGDSTPITKPIAHFIKDPKLLLQLLKKPELIQSVLQNKLFRTDDSLQEYFVNNKDSIMQAYLIYLGDKYKGEGYGISQHQSLTKKEKDFKAFCDSVIKQIVKKIKSPNLQQKLLTSVEGFGNYFLFLNKAILKAFFYNKHLTPKTSKEVLNVVFKYKSMLADLTFVPNFENTYDTDTLMFATLLNENPSFISKFFNLRLKPYILNSHKQFLAIKWITDFVTYLTSTQFNEYLTSHGLSNIDKSSPIYTSIISELNKVQDEIMNKRRNLRNK